MTEYRHFQARVTRRWRRKRRILDIALTLFSWNERWYFPLQRSSWVRTDAVLWHVWNAIDTLIHQLFIYAYDGSETEIDDAWEFEESWCSPFQLQVRNERILPL